MKRRLLKYSTAVAIGVILVFLAFIYFVPPGGLLSFFLFYGLFAASLFFVLTIFLDTERSIRFAVSVVLLLILRQTNQFNLTNILIISIINIITELFIRKNKRT